MTQSGRQRTRGLELEGRAALAQATHIHASLTWLAPQITASNGADLGLWAPGGIRPRASCEYPQCSTTTSCSPETNSGGRRC